MQNKTTYSRSGKRQHEGVARAGAWVTTMAAVFAALSVQGQTNAPAVEEKSPWEGSAALGLTLTRGNSDTTLFNLNIQGDRKKGKTELHLGLDGTYGESDGTKNNEQIKGTGQYNRTFGNEDRWYFYGRLEAYHDGIADIDGRFTLSPGMGYYFIKNEKISLRGEIGPGAVIEKLGGEDWDAYCTLRVAERFEYTINDRAKLWQSIEFLPEVTDFNNYIMNAEVGIETGITEKWALRVVFQDSYDSQPAPGRESNDMKLVAGVAYKF